MNLTQILGTLISALLLAYFTKIALKKLHKPSVKRQEEVKELQDSIKEMKEDLKKLKNS